MVSYRAADKYPVASIRSRHPGRSVDPDPHSCYLSGACQYRVQRSETPGSLYLRHRLGTGDLRWKSFLVDPE